jgi:hypothetical protein
VRSLESVYVARPIRQTVTRPGVDRDKLLAQINVIVHGLHCQLHNGTLFSWLLALCNLLR